MILSSNGDGRSERWRPLAEALAGQDFTALTYDWRGTNADVAGKDNWQLAVTDARAALAHARSSGVKRLVLVGGSLGGIASIKLGSEPDVAGVVALGTPYRTEPLGITPAEVKAIRGATLFISSEGDSIVLAAEVQWLHDQADGPRELHVYPGGAHGVDLLSSPHRDDVIARIARFVATALLKTGSGQGDDRAARWRNDVDALETALRKGHPKPFYKGNEAAFTDASRGLTEQIPALDDGAIKAGLMRLAAFSDGHTRIFFGQRAMGFHLYGIRLYKFADGVFVLNARSPYERLIGARLISIGDTAISDVLDRLMPYIEHDNAAWLDYLGPSYAIIPELLLASGIISDRRHPRFSFATTQGPVVADPPELDSDAYRAWEFLFQLPGRADMTLLSRRSEPFWFAARDDDRALYIQFNQVRYSSGSEDLPAFARRVSAALKDRDDWRVVVDLRNNGGGDNTTYGELLRLLSGDPINRPGRLYVLIGRNTFSAAANFAAELERQTKAVFVGEPMGASPNLYGDTRTYTLPDSGIEVWVSARYWQKSLPGDTRDTITPTLSALMTSVDWFAGRDPALAAALRR